MPMYGPPPGAIMRPMMGPPMMMRGATPPVLPRPAAGVPASGPAPKKTTLYVGKIAPTVPEEVVRQLLEACGRLRSWKPMKDPETGRPKGFGFAEFSAADGVLKALRLLNGLALDGQELMVKTDSATQRYIDEYAAQQEAERAAKDAGRGPMDVDDEHADRAGSRESGEASDEHALAAVMEIVSARDEVYKRDSAANQAASAATDFLSSLQGGSSSLPGPPPGPVPATAAVPPPVVSAASAPSPAGVSEPARASVSEPRSTSQAEDGSRSDRDRDADRDRRSRDNRETDRAYRDKLREWERYERDRGKAADAEKEHEKAVALERAKLVKQDAEGGEEAEEDPWKRKPYRGSRRAADRRRRREREEEEDAIDRRREERDSKKSRASREPDAAAGAAAGREPLANGDAAAHGAEPGTAAAAEGQVVVEAEPEPAPVVDPNDLIYQAMMVAAQAPQQRTPSPLLQQQQQQQAPAPAAAAGPALGAGAKGRPPSSAAMFGEEEEEEDRPARVLVPIKYSQEELQAVQAPVGAAEQQDTKATVKSIIDSIPTTRDGVFSYAVDWSAFDAAGEKLAGSVRGWVNKKMVELLGEEEEALAGFILDKLQAHAAAGQLLEELRGVLDEEADAFVLKLYRMVIFETERFAKLGA